MELKIKITGHVPLPINAAEMARAIIAIDDKLEELCYLVRGMGGKLRNESRTVNARQKEPEPPVGTTGASWGGALIGVVGNTDPFYIPPALKGGGG